MCILPLRAIWWPLHGNLKTTLEVTSHPELELGDLDVLMSLWPLNSTISRSAQRPEANYHPLTCVASLASNKRGNSLGDRPHQMIFGQVLHLSSGSHPVVSKWLSKQSAELIQNS